MRTLIRKIKVLIPLIFGVFVLMSCATQSIIIEFPEKSKNELPDSIQSVLLVSRVVDETYSNLNADSLQMIFYLQNFNYDTTIRDSMVVDTMLKAIGELLYNSGRYDYVIPENRFMPADNNVLLVRELPWDEVKNLCATYSTDALISIDHFRTSVSTFFDRASSFNPFEGGFHNALIAQMSVTYEALIRIYYPAQQKVIMRKLFQDTLFWEDYDIYTSTLFNRFTPVKNALLESGIAVALELSDEISPRWIQEWRTYFAKGDKNFEKATPLVEDNLWEPAMELWKETENNSKSKSLKSKAEYNIALGYEMIGDLDRAIEWALKSYNTMYRANTYEYLETLKRRKSEK